LRREQIAAVGGFAYILAYGSLRIRRAEEWGCHPADQRRTTLATLRCSSLGRQMRQQTMEPSDAQKAKGLAPLACKTDRIDACRGKHGRAITAHTEIERTLATH